MPNCGYARKKHGFLYPHNEKKYVFFNIRIYVIILIQSNESESNRYKGNGKKHRTFYPLKMWYNKATIKRKQPQRLTGLEKAKKSKPYA